MVFLHRHKTAIIAGAIILALLAGAWFLSDGSPGAVSPQSPPSAPEASAPDMASPPTPGTEPGDGSFTVTIAVRCDALLDNLDLLDNEKRELIPDDGVIFPATVVTANDGESVFDILAREMRNAGIHMVFQNMPFYDSAYIEAIGNIYEFDAGGLSGWRYSVNDWFPGYGISQYKLQAGDIIVLHYVLSY